ncbi:MAG TPA: antitoxin family protein [Nitrospiria bacterium]
MSKTIEAIFENGVFRPLERVDLKEHQRVMLILQDVKSSSENILELASHVYGNLSEKDIQEIEAIILRKKGTDLFS